MARRGLHHSAPGAGDFIPVCGAFRPDRYTTGPRARSRGRSTRRRCAVFEQPTQSAAGGPETAPIAGPSVSTRFVSFLREQRLRLAATPRQYAIYLAVYLTVGAINDWIGIRFRIAEFAHWWQVATCYGGYLVPVSLWVRRESPLRQYAVGVLALIPLELAGYALGTSIAHDGNVFDAVVGPRNFTLAMCVLFGVIPPAGNAIVRGIDRALERGRSAIFVRMERDPSV